MTHPESPPSPASLALERPRRLPRRPEETWEGGWIRMPAWVSPPGERPYRPTIGMWAVRSTGMVGPPGDLHESPDHGDARLLTALARFAEDRSNRHRPGAVVVADSDTAERLREPLASVEIDVRCENPLAVLDAAMVSLGEALRRRGRYEPPGLVEVPGLTPERLASFAESAAEFHRAAPWRHLVGEDLICVRAPKAPAGLEFTCVMGAGGDLYGLAFFPFAEAHCQTHTDPAPPSETIARLKGTFWSMTFGPVTELAFADADAWEDRQLALDGEEAYPHVAGYQRNEIRAPGLAELDFLDGLMRAIARSTDDDLDSGRWSITLDHHGVAVRYEFELPYLIDPLPRQEWFKWGFSPDPRMTEEMNAMLQRHLEAHPVESEAELRRVIEQRFMGKSLDDLHEAPRNAPEAAQDLCFQAFDTHGRRRVQLARRALALDPHCIDACVLMAEHAAKDHETALSWYTRGVEAGRATLGDLEALRVEHPELWGYLPGRRYLRALGGLGLTQRMLQRWSEAVTALQECSRLSAADPLMTRPVLLGLLLRLERDAEADALAASQSADSSPVWLFARALVAFRDGRRDDADAALALAIRRGPRTAKLLAGKPTAMRRVVEGEIGPDSPEEIVSMLGLGSAWSETRGATAWLTEHLRAKKKDREVKRKTKAPGPRGGRR